jgi:hypothetical protein
MATTPTDDPLERTVGVRTDPDQDLLKLLKRDALLFDLIAILDLDHNRQYLGIVEELDRLQEGFIRWGLVTPTGGPTFDRQYLAEIAAETGEPIDVMAIPDERLWGEVTKRVWWGGVSKEPDVVAARFSRMYSNNLRREGINAFPILPTRRQIENVFPSGIAPVLEVVLKSMPIPDDETPWKQIVEFRNDPESMKRLRRLRVWTRKFAKATTATSLAEMKEEIEVLLDDYEEHMKLHRMKVNKGATETLVTVAGNIAEDLVKVKWGELAKLPFILRERKISLTDAERDAPNRELAFISMARSRFSK